MSSDEKAFGVSSYHFPDKLTLSLSAALDGTMAIVEAPMGYGKTTAVRECLRNKPVDIVWVSIDSPSIQGMWETLAEAFSTAFPDKTEIVSCMRAMGSMQNSRAEQDLLRACMQATFHRPVMVVIDDYHHVNTKENAYFTDQVAKAQLQNLRLVLITRDAYLGNAEYLSVKGILSIVRRDKFLLEPEDIKVFFSKHMASLTSDQASFLYQQTEGWICAIYMYLRRYQAEGIIAFPTEIYEMLDHEVYTQLQEDIKQFLLAVCPFGCFSYKQAEFVWQNDDIRKIIKCLRLENSFVSYDDRSKLFSVHPIYLKFLQNIFSRLAEPRQAELWSRWGDWFRQAGEYFRAMECYKEAGNYEKLIGTIAADCGKSITIERRPFFDSLLQTFPPEIKSSDPRAVISLLLNLVLMDGGDAYRSHFDQLRAYVQSLPDDHAARPLISAIGDFVQAFEHYNDIAAMSRLHRSAWEKLGGPLNDFDVFTSCLTMGSPSVMMMFHKDIGMLEEEAAMLTSGMTVYSKLTHGHGMGANLIMDAERHFYAGDMEKARIKAFTAETVALQYERPGIACCAKLLLARIAIVEGNGADMKARLREAADIAEKERTDKHTLKHMYILGNALLGLHLQEKAQNGELPEPGSFDATRFYLFAWPVCAVLQTNLMLKACEYERLIGTAAALMNRKEYARHLLLCIYMDIYIAVAQLALKHPEVAKVHLRRALEAAVPDQIYMPFSENCDSLESLFCLFEKEDMESRHITHIRELALRLKKGVSNIAGTGADDKSLLLTKREYEIASLAARGRTNRQIAQELFIAHSTVKRALVIIFKKTGVTERGQLKLYLPAATRGGEKGGDPLHA